MVLYPDDPSHVECISKLEKNGYMYAGCLHSEDIYSDNETDDPNLVGNKKKAHWHIVLSVKNPRFAEPLADELGISSNYLQVCRNRDSALCYLIHDGYPGKYQYDLDEVFGSLKDCLPRLLSDDTEGLRIMHILSVLDSMPVPCSYRRLLTRCCELDLYGDFRRMGVGIMRLLDEHNAGTE